MEVVNEGKYLFWRGFDANRAFDTESVWLGRGVNEYSSYKRDNDDNYKIEHEFLL
jgi:hypothetical protein